MNGNSSTTNYPTPVGLSHTAVPVLQLMVVALFQNTITIAIFNGIAEHVRVNREPLNEAIFKIDWGDKSDVYSVRKYDTQFDEETHKLDEIQLFNHVYRRSLTSNDTAVAISVELMTMPGMVLRIPYVEITPHSENYTDVTGLSHGILVPLSFEISTLFCDVKENWCLYAYNVSVFQSRVKYIVPKSLDDRIMVGVETPLQTVETMQYLFYGQSHVFELEIGLSDGSNATIPYTSPLIESRLNNIKPCPSSICMKTLRYGTASGGTKHLFVTIIYGNDDNVIYFQQTKLLITVDSRNYSEPIVMDRNWHSTLTTRTLRLILWSTPTDVQHSVSVTCELAPGIALAKQTLVLSDNEWATELYSTNSILLKKSDYNLKGDPKSWHTQVPTFYANQSFMPPVDSFGVSRMFSFRTNCSSSLTVDL
jgi:hypothetical protein